MSLSIHTSILEKLNYFYKNRKIPNLIFHGPTGCGKRTLVNTFIDTIYQGDRETIKTMVRYVNCAHGKGIKFIREELKFFAKMHIPCNGGDNFKSIILSNADKLTIDAQSALRRCIELFSHNTRFFIIVEDKYKLLKPILSRFCEIYVPEPMYKGEMVNLYTHHLQHTFLWKEKKTARMEWLKKELQKLLCGEKIITNTNLISYATKWYEKAYSGLDIIYLLDKSKIFDNYVSEEKKYELIFAFHKVRKEFRNEKLLFIFILNFLFLQLDSNLETISFM